MEVPGEGSGMGSKKGPMWRGSTVVSELGVRGSRVGVPSGAVGWGGEQEGRGTHSPRAMQAHLGVQAQLHPKTRQQLQ